MELALEAADEIIKQNNEKYDIRPQAEYSTCLPHKPEINQLLHKFAFVWDGGIEKEIIKTDTIGLSGDNQKVNAKHLEEFANNGEKEDANADVKQEQDVAVKMENQHMNKC